MNSDKEVEALWTPSDDDLCNSQLARFQRAVAERHGIPAQGYDQLWEWSVRDIGEFWAEVWRFFGLDATSSSDVGVSTEAVLATDAMPGARWFPGAEINVAAHVFRRWDNDREAVIGTSEASGRRVLTGRQLKAAAQSFAVSLQRMGVTRGDRVVGYLPNIPETVVAFLGCAAIGAIWSSVGQDYAAGAVVDRFAQLEPVVLVAADGYHWGGQTIDRLPAIDQVRDAIPSLRQVVVVSNTGGEALDGTIAWAETVAGPVEGFEPVMVPFDEPMWVLYSSGTTGLPKGLVHSHGGILLEMLKTHALHFDIGSRDRFMWYTSPSWVMWNIQTCALAVGASIVCYDGAPTAPTADRLWQVVADERVTFFGVSPGLLQAWEAAGVRPAQQLDLSALRGMGSTGSPISPHSHRWARANVGPIPPWSVSGGTDVGSGFAGGTRTVPIWVAEISVPCLGVALDAWDDDGRPVRGQVGEMVITRPMPSMPVMLWNDPDFTRYRQAYFDVFPGVWRHGDWITITERGSLVIHGRSDSTLNRNGVRMGSADIYAAVDAIPEVVESLVIGAEQEDGGYWMPLFVVLDDGVKLDDELRSRITTVIREHASPRHVPDEIRQVRGIPHTRTGKKLEVPVKRILQGAVREAVANPDTIDDPSLLEEFVAYRGMRAGS